jgi:hypothetical protein
MTLHTLFVMLCAVLAFHVVIAIISIARAYRRENKSLFGRPVVRWLED